MGKFFIATLLATSAAIADIGNCNAILRNSPIEKQIANKRQRCAYSRYADSTIRVKTDINSVTVDGLVCDYFAKCTFTCSIANSLQQMSERDLEEYILNFNFSQQELKYLLEINKGYRKCHGK